MFDSRNNLYETVLINIKSHKYVIKIRIMNKSKSMLHCPLKGEFDVTNLSDN